MKVDPTFEVNPHSDKFWLELLEFYRHSPLKGARDDAALFRSMSIKDQLELLFYMVNRTMMAVTGDPALGDEDRPQFDA